MIFSTTRSLSRMSSALPNAISTLSSNVSVVPSASVADTFVTRPASSVVMPDTMSSALFTLSSEQYVPISAFVP